MTAPTPSAAQVLRDVLEECIVTMGHAEIFIRSREKMHPDGQGLYRATLDQARSTLEDTQDIDWERLYNDMARRYAEATSILAGDRLALQRLHDWAQAQSPDTFFGGDHPIALAREALR